MHVHASRLYAHAPNQLPHCLLTDHVGVGIVTSTLLVTAVTVFVVVLSAVVCVVLN